MEDLVDDTAKCFVPEMLVEFINKNIRKGKECVEPESFFLTGVCLLVDISGFTKLSGDFCGMGKSGIDELQLATNGYMGQLVEIIYKFGGEIIKFAGDAIICVFSSHFISNVSVKIKGGRMLRRSVCSFNGILAGVDIATHLNSTPLSPSTKASPLHFKIAQPSTIPSKPITADVILRAMHCAEILKDVQTEKLSVHVAMSCGEMCFGILGGYENRWECLISGTCIHELSDCLDDAPSKHAVISKDCGKILISTPHDEESEVEGMSTLTTESGRYQFNLLELPSGNYRIVYVTCENNGNIKPTNTKDTYDSSTNTTTTISLQKTNSHTHQHHNQSDKHLTLKLVRQFVPVPIADQLEGGTGLSYLAEIREVTTMFMKWDSYDAPNKHRNLLALQHCFYEAQRILQRTGAYLRQFLVDDKGCVLIACWGMPNLSYLDNAHRALSAAAQIRRKLKKMDMVCSFGITTGDVYCGTVGSAVRMEYAAIGSVVNMSARLMCKANGGILIDDATHSRLPADIHNLLTALDPIKVKGREEPLQVYSYHAAESIQVHEKVVEDHAISLSHREILMKFLTIFQENASKTVLPQLKTRRGGIANVKDWISNTQFNHISNLPYDLNTLPILLVKGTEGSGKTTIVKWFRKHVQEQQIPIISIKLSRKDTINEYIIWRKFFELLMPKGTFLTTDMQRTYVHALLNEIYPNASHTAIYTAFPVMKEVLGITCNYYAYNNPAPALLHHHNNGNKGRWINSQLSIQSNNSVGSLISSPSGLRSIRNSTVIDTLTKIFTYLLNAQTSMLFIESIENADEGSLKVLCSLMNSRSRSAVILTALDSINTDTTTNTNTNSTTTNGNNNSSSSLNHHIITFQTGSYRKNILKSSAWIKYYKTKITNDKSTTTITLTNYTNDEIEQLLCKTLNVQTVPVDILQLVQDFSGGSCFWVREILQFIAEYGTEQFMSAIGEKENNTTSATTSSSNINTSSTSNSSGYLSAHSSYDNLNILVNNNNNNSTTINNGNTSPIKMKYLSTSSSTSTSNFQRKPSSSHSSFRVRTMNSTRFPYEISSSTTPNTTAIHHVQLDKLILCRFGNLSSDVQRILRTASIIGMTFSGTILVGVLPTQLKEHIMECFQTLMNQRWIYQDIDNNTLFQFAHIHSHQLIYQLTPSSERNIIHKQIGLYIEETYPDDKNQYVLLSYHFQQCDPDKSLHYVCLAVDYLLQAKSIYDFGDCLDLLAITALNCCRTTNHIDLLMNLINKTRLVIESFDPIPKNENEFTFSGCLLKLFCTTKKNIKTTTIVPTNTNDTTTTTTTATNIHTYMDTDLELSNKYSNISESEHFEIRAKDMFLQQLSVLYDEVCEKYVDFVDAEF